MERILNNCLKWQSGIGSGFCTNGFLLNNITPLCKSVKVNHSVWVFHFLKLSCLSILKVMQNLYEKQQKGHGKKSTILLPSTTTPILSFGELISIFHTSKWNLSLFYPWYFFLLPNFLSFLFFCIWKICIHQRLETPCFPHVIK